MKTWYSTICLHHSEWYYAPSIQYSQQRTRSWWYYRRQCYETIFIDATMCGWGHGVSFRLPDSNRETLFKCIKDVFLRLNITNKAPRIPFWINMLEWCLELFQACLGNYHLYIILQDTTREVSLITEVVNCSGHSCRNLNHPDIRRCRSLCFALMQ